MNVDALKRQIQLLRQENKSLKLGRSKSSKTFVSVSDMHVGSAMALAPAEILVGDNDLVIKPNKIMSRMYEIWQNCLDRVTKTPDVLGVVGEPMDGDNVKQVGQQSWSTNFNDQVRGAISLLKEWKAKNIVMVRGSGYHVHRGATNYEEMVARGINATRYRMYLPQGVNISLGRNDKGQELVENMSSLTDYIANFRLNGKVFNLTHHIGFSKNESYRTTGLAREMVTMKLSEDFYGKADIFVRGHVHYHVRVGFTHTQGYTNPAWKLPDAHLFRGGQGGTKPDIGPNETVIIRPIIEELNIKPTVTDFG